MTDLATVTLYALDTMVGLLKAAHGEHPPAECSTCWHVHDELDHVEAALAAEMHAELLEAAA